MKHVFWVYRNELAGRPGPGVAPWRLSDFAGSGIDVLLSVASDLFPHSEAAASGLARACIPFPDLVPPDELTYRQCRANLRLTSEVIDSNLRRGRRVLVHCAGGNDRTGLVLAHYIARREGLGAAEAVRRLRETRPQALSARGWEAMALDLIGR